MQEYVREILGNTLVVCSFCGVGCFAAILHIRKNLRNKCREAYKESVGHYPPEHVVTSGDIYKILMRQEGYGV